MTLPRGKGPVATWWLENDVVEALDWPTIERSLGLCETAVSILREHDLLLPRMASLSKWMTAGPWAVAQGQRVERASLNISVDPDGPLTQVASSCRLAIESEGIYPLTIEISGVGLVITEQDTSVPTDDLVWIRTTTLDTFAILIATQSDVWMPFSLAGTPQPKLSERNADRLATALDEIIRRTGLSLEEGVSTPYSVVNGFRVENVRYADGSIVDVT